MNITSKLRTLYVYYIHNKILDVINKKSKKEKFVFILFSFITLYGIIGLIAGFDRSTSCNDHAIWMVEQREIKGVLISKEKYCLHHNFYAIIKVGDTATVKHYMGYSFGCMYDYIEPNDSIIKVKNEPDYLVIRNGTKRFFSMDCEHDCSCSRIP